MKFIEIELKEGGLVALNPDQVAYLRRNREGATAIVFGAVAGGLHQLIAAGDLAQVRRLLELGDDVAL